MAKKKLRFPKADRLGHIKKDGSENVSSKPTELRAKIQAPVSLREKMKSLWAEFREKEIADSEQESNADAQDFDVSNDDFPSSPYEIAENLEDLIGIAESQLSDLKEELSQEQVQPAEKENSDDSISGEAIQE
jgi:hypothetical protein